MVQLNLLLEYVAAGNEAANLLPKWVWHVICSIRTCTEGSSRLQSTGGIENSQDIGQKCVCVCEVPYTGSMLSKAGKVHQLNRTKLKSVSAIWTGHCPQQGTFTNLDKLVIKLLQVLSVMKCPAYSIMNIGILCSLCKWELKTFDRKFARVGAVWVSVEPNIRWQYEVLLGSSRSDVRRLLRFTQHVSVVLLVEQHEKLCFIVPSFETGTILLSKVLSFYTMEHLRWLLCKWLWDIHTIQKLL